MSFATLYHSLAATSSTKAKVELLVNYLSKVSESEFGWAVFLLRGGTLRRTISGKVLREGAAESSGVPLGLVEESYYVVGDLAETCALLVARDGALSNGSLIDWIAVCEEVRAAELTQKQELVTATWKRLSQDEAIVFNKLLTGGLRIGVSHGLVARALAEIVGSESGIIAHRLLGSKLPGDIMRSVLSADVDRAHSLVSYPFFLAHPFEESLLQSGNVAEWGVEWKWDGIRAHLVKRAGRLALWSRGEEIVTEQFPEFEQLASIIEDGTVLDGEVVAWSGETPGSFGELQKRLNRKKVSAALLKSSPVRFIAYDLLERRLEDIRAQAYEERRRLLEVMVREIQASTDLVRLSPLMMFDSWQHLVERKLTAKEHNAEGVMVKRLQALYGVGRTKGEWWKWKIDPLSVDAVLIYAQRGHGRRANLFTDFTFAVWSENQLVPFAKAYSGLTDSELREVDKIIKDTVVESFGPVRAVRPSLVFELAFDSIQPSKRHKSGVAVRFPRIKRWRRDKKIAEADTLSTVRALAGG